LADRINKNNLLDNNKIIIYTAHVKKKALQQKTSTGGELYGA
jgi:hypothetical protein